MKKIILSFSSLNAPGIFYTEKKEQKMWISIVLTNASDGSICYYSQPSIERSPKIWA